MEEDTPPATDLFLAMMGGVFTKADMARWVLYGQDGRGLHQADGHFL